MKIFEKATMNIMRSWSIVKTQVGHYAPEIQFYGGGVLIIAGVITAYVEGRKAEKEGHAAEFKQELNEINECYGTTPRAVRRKAVANATTHYVVSEAKHVVGPVVLTGLGLYFKKRAMNSVKKSVVLLEAALATSTLANKQLNKNLVDTFGEEGRDALLLNGNTQEIERVEENEEGERFPYKDTYLVTEVNNLPGEAFIYSKETVAYGEYIDDDGYFTDMIDNAVANGNLLLRNIDGYVFEDNLIKRCFGVEPNAVHRTNGWLYHGNNTKDAVEFYTRKIFIKYDDGSLASAWLVIPNSDGVIIDKYHKYSLRTLSGGKK